MKTVEIDAGICGFTTIVRAEKTTGYKAVFKLETTCSHWKSVQKHLGSEEIDLMVELFKNKETGEPGSRIMKTAVNIIPHISCPVIPGILKALEASAGLALPKDATICFKE